MRVVVGLSGGVDSSVAALLLKQQGHEVLGLFMKNWEEDDTETYCAASRDLADAAQVCERLAIPLKTINFSAAYWDHVFNHFLSEYAKGRTPNPDILCNREIKFKAFLAEALRLGADKMATGHYCSLSEQAGVYQLSQASDLTKDQTYFLYTLQQSQLEKSLFPLASLPKKQVRSLARDHGLLTHDKKDSTGICFIGERKFRDFLSRYLPAQPGPITDVAGSALGQHGGLMYYTLGQRKGLYLGGKKGYREAPWYVAAKDLRNNRLIVTQEKSHPWFFCQSAWVEHPSWITRPTQPKPKLCAKVRYRHSSVPCRVLNTQAEVLEVHFETPQAHVTPGQSLVFYEGSVCLGGGIISKTDSPGGLWVDE